MARHNDGMTAAEELVPWLRAQLDEDERVAQAATPGPWHAQDGGVVNDDDDQWPVSRTESERDRADRVHIARHDPATVLLDIAAKRKILAALDEQRQKLEANVEAYAVAMRNPAANAMDLPSIKTHGWTLQGRIDALTTVLRWHAEAFDARPGYREEWRP